MYPLCQSKSTCLNAVKKIFLSFPETLIHSLALTYSALILSQVFYTGDFGSAQTPVISLPHHLINTSLKPETAVAVSALWRSWSTHGQKTTETMRWPSKSFCRKLNHSKIFFLDGSRVRNKCFGTGSIGWKFVNQFRPCFQQSTRSMVAEGSCHCRNNQLR